MATMKPTYKGLVKRSGGASGGTPIHVLPDDAEASLCGIPRAELGLGSGSSDGQMCGECLDAFTAANRARSRVKLPPEYKPPKSI